MELGFVHDNTSISFKGGAVFGLHFQSIPFAEEKPVRQVLGKLSDVTIDIRTYSPTYEDWVGTELD